jgi:hypothetical protein
MNLTSSNATMSCRYEELLCSATLGSGIEVLWPLASTPNHTGKVAQSSALTQQIGCRLAKASAQS